MEPTVLAVEDDESTNELYEFYLDQKLDREDYNLEFASTFEQAKTTLQEKTLLSPVAIILDLQFPREEGGAEEYLGGKLTQKWIQPCEHPVTIVSSRPEKAPEKIRDYAEAIYKKGGSLDHGELTKTVDKMLEKAEQQKQRNAAELVAMLEEEHAQLHKNPDLQITDSTIQNFYTEPIHQYTHHALD